MSTYKEKAEMTVQLANEVSQFAKYLTQKCSDDNDVDITMAAFGCAIAAVHLADELAKMTDNYDVVARYMLYECIDVMFARMRNFLKEQQKEEGEHGKEKSDR